MQCKSAWRNKEQTIRFETHSQTTDDGAYHEQTYEGAIDAFVARFPETEALYWIDMEEATDQKMELRFGGDIDHPSINWAEESVFAGEIPRVHRHPYRARIVSGPHGAGGPGAVKRHSRRGRERNGRR